MCGIWAYLLNNKENLNNVNIWESFMKIKNRGPDKSTLEYFDNVILGFHRLSIMDPSTKGDQPFKIEKNNHTIYTVCNGEIYNYKEIKEEHNYHLHSNSDCEIIPRLYSDYGIKKTLELLNGEFAFILVDINHHNNTTKIYLCRDRFGIRPMFYMITPFGIQISSELKGLDTKNTENINLIQQVPPRSFTTIAYVRNKWDIVDSKEYYSLQENTKIGYNINHLDYNLNKVRESLIEAVKCRLDSDRPLGCLLSGGLDSSLVASIAAKELSKKGEQLRTFSIGLPGSTDEYYAKLVANHIGSIHKHIEFTNDDFFVAISDVIYAIESFDITTVRASVGQYLVSKWIAKHTDIKVLLIGDGSDELCAGYMYFHNAPNPEESHRENVRLLEDIHLYDVLRADRGISNNGIEARVPFLDYNFVNTYLGLEADLRSCIDMNNNKRIEKWFLRESFKDNYLPNEVLYRKKEAFSDGVSSKEKSWYVIIQEFVEKLYTNDEFNSKSQLREYLQPITKEGLLYREIFENSFGQDIKVSQLIPYYWLPKWSGDIKEPSARVLNVYNNSIL